MNAQPDSLNPTREPSTLNAPRLVASTASDIENFLATGDSAYRRQREKLEQAEQTYRAERFKLQADYERRLQLVVNEAKDTLRNLDQKHEKAQAKGQRVLAALAHLRDG